MLINIYSNLDKKYLQVYLCLQKEYSKAKLKKINESKLVY